jgi:hypothetical protein
VDRLPNERAGELMADIYCSGQDFPAVLVDGRLACASGIDLGAVRRALAHA